MIKLISWYVVSLKVNEPIHSIKWGLTIIQKICCVNRQVDQAEPQRLLLSTVSPCTPLLICSDFWQALAVKFEHKSFLSDDNYLIRWKWPCFLNWECGACHCPLRAVLSLWILPMGDCRNNCRTRGVAMVPKVRHSFQGEDPAVTYCRAPLLTPGGTAREWRPSS